MTVTARIKVLAAALVGIALTALPSRPASGQDVPRPSVFQTTLEEPKQAVPEITTEELHAILADGTIPVFDVRTAKEYAIAHIPGAINVYEKEVQHITQLYPDKDTSMILYCNGPSCGKSKRTSEELVALKYTNVKRYQLGLPVWRALSQTVQTDMAGVLYIRGGDQTAVWVDARARADFQAASIPGAVNVQKGEATAANDDGRLPFQDKGTRVVVFGATAQQARVVAAEIAKKAYWNSSYFGGTFDDLAAAGVINHRPIVVAKNATMAAGPACTATPDVADVNNGSHDPDSGDTLELTLTPAGPLAPGHHMLTLTGADGRDAAASATAFVTVVDETKPVLGAISVNRQPQRSGQQRMLLVTVEYSATDNCRAVTTELTVTSHGGDRGWLVLDAHHVLLNAPGIGLYSDEDAERRYTIAVVATDTAGNQTVQAVGLRGPVAER
jgi:rhodanese-related sulfurtransferase